MNLLVEKHGGSLAELNIRLGLDRTDSTLSQVRTKSPATQTKKPRSMGNALARRIETALQLPIGWMDTPLSVVEKNGEDDPRVKAMAILESIPTTHRNAAVRLLDVFAQAIKQRQTH